MNIKLLQFVMPGGVTCLFAHIAHTLLCLMSGKKTRVTDRQTDRGSSYSGSR